MAPAPQPSARPAARDAGNEVLDALRERAEAAARAAGGWVENDLALAGVEVSLRFAGPALADLLAPPFEHLAGGVAAGPALRIAVFDSDSTGVAPPPLPWSPTAVEPGTNPIARLETESTCILAATATGALTAAAPPLGEAIFFLPGAGCLPPSERAAPLREALQILMAPRRRWMAHSAAVGRDGRGVLLAGRSGSGKSTLALACALAGMDLLADDYLLLESGSPPLAHAMHSTVKLTADSVARLGLEAGTVGFEPSLEGPGKALLDARRLVPGRVRRRLEVGALVAPTVAELARPELVPASAASGLRALAPSTILQMPARVAPLLGALGELVRVVPSYELRLSGDPAANAAAVDAMVDGLG